MKEKEKEFLIVEITARIVEAKKILTETNKNINFIDGPENISLDNWSHGYRASLLKMREMLEKEIDGARASLNGTKGIIPEVNEVRKEK